MEKTRLDFQLFCERASLAPHHWEWGPIELTRKLDATFCNYLLGSFDLADENLDHKKKFYHKNLHGLNSNLWSELFFSHS